MRNLDLTALRAFVTVADSGGVTRAAGLLNLTQSAVSMQLRRLEEALGLNVYTRAARKLALTPEGEQLLGYARRMLALNDEALARLTSDVYEGELRLGVPHDIVYPQIPAIMRRLATLYPRMRINLVSSGTLRLREGFARGEFDVILTTEEAAGPGGEVLAERGLLWISAPGGTAPQRRPLRLAFEDTCKFRPTAQTALDQAGIAWEMAFLGQSCQAQDATAAADLAVTVRIAGEIPVGCAVVPPEAGLPPLGSTKICLYEVATTQDPVRAALVAELHRAYGPCAAC